MRIITLLLLISHSCHLGLELAVWSVVQQIWCSQSTHTSTHNLRPGFAQDWRGDCQEAATSLYHKLIVTEWNNGILHCEIFQCVAYDVSVSLPSGKIGMLFYYIIQAGCSLLKCTQLALNLFNSNWTLNYIFANVICHIDSDEQCVYEQCTHQTDFFFFSVPLEKLWFLEVFL